MSDTAQAVESVTVDFTKELIKITAVNAAATAGIVSGFVVAAVVVDQIKTRRAARKAKKIAENESE